LSYDIANPDPAGTITSLRSLGYSIEAAIADLIDNSLSAGARRIDVFFTWAGSDSWVAVVDDGCGMTTRGLISAMTVAARGSYDARASEDLGRFGMGLKSASFSQAGRLTVGTRHASSAEDAVRTWDLSVVAETGEWRLLHGADEDTVRVLKDLRPEGGPGTAVVWRDLHRFVADGVTSDDVSAQKQFYGEATRVEEHLGMVFARFLAGRNRVTMTVNEVAVKAWDPFLGNHPSVQRLPVEHLPVGGHIIRIEPFILPHPKKLDAEQQKQAAGPGGLLDQQGFYVYRRDRLIMAGDWLGIRGFRRDERYNLARLVVEVPAEADADWAIDVRKSTAVPPVAIRRHLTRIGTAARSRAAEVLSHRGRIAARERGAEFVYAWRVEKRDGGIRCRINRDHPLVREVLQGGPDAVVDARALIRLLEETVPVAALRILHDGDATDDPEPFLDAPSKEVNEVANRVYAAFVNQGSTPREAKERLAASPPFDRFDGFWRHS